MQWQVTQPMESAMSSFNEQDEVSDPGGKQAGYLLQVNNKTQVIKTYPIARSCFKYIIGRADVSGIVMEHASVSNEHAEIEVEDGILWVVDKNSTNCTRIGDKMHSAESPNKACKPGRAYQVNSKQFMTLGDVQLRYYHPADYEALDKSIFLPLAKVEVSDESKSDAKSAGDERNPSGGSTSSRDPKPRAIDRAETQVIWGDDREDSIGLTDDDEMDDQASARQNSELPATLRYDPKNDYESDKQLDLPATLPYDPNEEEKKLELSATVSFDPGLELPATVSYDPHEGNELNSTNLPDATQDFVMSVAKKELSDNTLMTQPFELTVKSNPILETQEFVPTISSEEKEPLKDFALPETQDFVMSVPETGLSDHSLLTQPSEPFVTSNALLETQEFTPSICTKVEQPPKKEVPETQAALDEGDVTCDEQESLEPLKQQDPVQRHESADKVKAIPKSSSTSESSLGEYWENVEAKVESAEVLIDTLKISTSMEGKTKLCDAEHLEGVNTGQPLPGSQSTVLVSQDQLTQISQSEILPAKLDFSSQVKEAAVQGLEVKSLPAEEAAWNEEGKKKKRSLDKGESLKLYTKPKSKKKRKESMPKNPATFPMKKRRLSTSTEPLSQSAPRRSPRKTARRKVYLLRTGFTNSKENKELRKMGAIILNSVAPRLTHLCVDKFRTTEKVLCGLAYCDYLVSDRWPTACSIREDFDINEVDCFIKRDDNLTKVERELGFKLTEVIRKRNRRITKVFNGLRLFKTQIVNPAFANMFVAHGGKLAISPPRKPSPQIIVIGLDDSDEQAQNFLSKKYKVRSPSWVKASIFRQELPKESEFLIEHRT